MPPDLTTKDQKEITPARLRQAQFS